MVPGQRGTGACVSVLRRPAGGCTVATWPPALIHQMTPAMQCEIGGCEREAVYQTYFLGGPFMKLCAECEARLFPSVLSRDPQVDVPKPPPRNQFGWPVFYNPLERENYNTWQAWRKDNPTAELRPRWVGKDQP